MPIPGIPDDRSDVDLAIAAIGPDARPTGRVRILRAAGSTAQQIQSEWRGAFGTMWIDAPIIIVDHLPARSLREWLAAMSTCETPMTEAEVRRHMAEAKGKLPPATMTTDEGKGSRENGT
jgi:hypothetical protein